MAPAAPQRQPPFPGAAWQHFLRAVSGFAHVRAVKSYRLPVPVPADVPRLPCLDHEAMLHEDIAPHVSLYLEDLDGGGLHEVAWVPARRRIEVDVVSTSDEHGPNRTRVCCSGSPAVFRTMTCGSAGRRGCAATGGSPAPAARRSRCATS